MRTGEMSSKLVTDSRCIYCGVQNGYVLAGSHIVGFDVELERLFGVGVGIGESPLMMNATPKHVALNLDVLSS